MGDENNGRLFCSAILRIRNRLQETSAFIDRSKHPGRLRERHECPTGAQARSRPVALALCAYAEWKRCRSHATTMSNWTAIASDPRVGRSTHHRHGNGTSPRRLPPLRQLAPAQIRAFGTEVGPATIALVETIMNTTSSFEHGSLPAPASCNMPGPMAVPAWKRLASMC